MNRKISTFAGKISLVCLAILIGLSACTPAPAPARHRLSLLHLQ